MSLPGSAQQHRLDIDSASVGASIWAVVVDVPWEQPVLLK